MATTIKDLVTKCVENPDRPVYYIGEVYSFTQDDTKYLGGIQANLPAQMHCKYYEMRDMARYQKMLDDPYIAEMLDDPEITTYDLKTFQRTINLDTIESVERINDQICIFTPNAVYSTINFIDEYELAMQKVDEQRLNEKRTNELRIALSNANTMLKKDLKSFCDRYDIDYPSKGKLIVPKEEFDEMIKRINKALEEKGIDIATVKEISGEDFQDIIEAGRSIFEEQKRAAEKAAARAALEQVIPIGKPLIFAEQMSITINGSHSLIQHMDRRPNHNVVATLAFHGHPLEKMDRPNTIYSDKLYMQNVAVKDITEIGTGTYAIELDNAVLISCNNFDPSIDLREEYKNYLITQGIPLSPYNGQPGVFYQMASYMGNGYNILDEIRDISGKQDEIFGRTATCLARNEREDYGLFCLTNADCWISYTDVNGISHASSFTNLVPGMNIELSQEKVRPMGSMEFEHPVETMKILDCELLDGIAIIVTDKGIFTNIDISAEIERSRDELGISKEDIAQSFGERNN